MIIPFGCVVGNIWPRSDEHGCAGRGRARGLKVPATKILVVDGERTPERSQATTCGARVSRSSRLRNPRHPPPARRTARERAQIEVSDKGKGMPPKTCHTPSSAHTRGEVSDARGHRRQLRGRFVTGDSPWSHLTIRWRGRRRKPPRTRPRPLYPKSGLTRRDEPAAYYAFLYSVFTSKVPSGRL